MNVENINPFVQGTKQVLKNVCNIDGKVGKIFLKNSPFENKLNITIGIVGDISGYVNYSFNQDVALFLASKMMFTNITSLDEISKSAICELSNMICGGVANIFSNEGKVIDITHPKLEENYIECVTSKFLAVPLEIEKEKIFEVNVFLNN